MPTESTALSSNNLEFIESLYAEFERDPASVSPEWRQYFDGIAKGDGIPPVSRPNRVGTQRSPGTNGPGARRDMEVALRQDRVDQLIRAYRVRGHAAADLDPLGTYREPPPELDPVQYGFTAEDMERPVASRTVFGPNVRTLGQLINRMKNTYCRTIGVQFMHIDDLDKRHWLQDHMEGTENHLKLGREEQHRILKRLTDAVVFEEFIQKKYIGAKSFSLEGAESLIPLLDLAIERAGDQGIEEIVMAMAHRGRLNVLANIIGKKPHQILREFEDVDVNASEAAGDVKYHLGYSSDWQTASGRKVHLSLCFNPSHLEFVDPVAMGRMRAKQDRVRDTQRERGMVLMIHGDASFAGEGVVQETLNMSELRGYTVGGTLHVVVNNQIGFTTSPDDARSSVYATGVARMLQVPIFHVNGEDPEAVAQVVHLCMDFRKEFKTDVIIDMYSYRLRGHNEGDEPDFTQPLMYAAIKQRMRVRDAYLEHLLTLGEVTREEADRIEAETRERLEQALSKARSDEYISRTQHYDGGIWNNYVGGPEADAPEVNTGVDAQRLAALLDVQTRFPIDFHPHPKIERAVANRREMAEGKRPLDWSSAEALAFATLATEGITVRISGQDTERGTFSHRHAVLHDIQDGHTYTPLQHLAPDQASFEIYNSPLSENGVLGFEYGYSLDCPDGLVAWEAQFGDFVNAAQVIIDQFIAASEEKWDRLSGVVLLLPHGFEGQGPEHSSARLERFLSLAANDNIQIVNPTTPGQYFHVLRRQVLRPWRKPLVVMTPKSLLRHPRATSPLQDLAEGTFQRIIPDDQPDNDAIRRILLCSGKVYYDLLKEREKLNRHDVAIIRVEQLYPLSNEVLCSVLAPYRDGTPACWVQEEPENMGAWRYIRIRFGAKLLDRMPLRGVYRPASASPAIGSAHMHQFEQQQLIERAFGDGTSEVQSR